MGKQKDKPAGTEGDQPEDQPPAPEGQKDDKAGQRDLVKSILAELAESGEIFGGGSDEGDPPPKTGPPPAEGAPLDLEAAVARVLERRETESKAREKETEREATLTDLKEKVGKGLGRVRRWFEPASPWGD